MSSASSHVESWQGALPATTTDLQRERLMQFVQLLQRWNKVYNLTAVRDASDMLTVHLADCLAALPGIAARHPARLLDVGSGGGLPGMVLGIMLPETHVVLNDAVQKKCAFLQQACATLRLPNVEVVHARVETLDSGLFNCITSRAFSDLATFVRLTRPRLAPGGAWAAMKGRVPDEEIAALPPDIDVHVDHLDVPGLAAQRCIVWMQPRSGEQSFAGASSMVKGAASRPAPSQTDSIGES